MVCGKLHIICGNCGQDLTQKGMAEWEYIKEDSGFSSSTEDYCEPPDVEITCKNCDTVHNLSNYMVNKNWK